MKNIKIKKTALRSETIRRLTTKELREIGGAGEQQCETTSWPTDARPTGA